MIIETSDDSGDLFETISWENIYIKMWTLLQILLFYGLDDILLSGLLLLLTTLK